MVEWGRGKRGDRGADTRAEERPDTGAQTRAETWPPGSARPRGRMLARPAQFPDAVRSVAEPIGRWVAAEAGPSRLMPWMPVAFGLGIAIYFAAEREPQAWAAAGLAIVCCAVAYLARRRPAGFPIALVLAAIAAGFATATLRSAAISHPVLTRPAGVVEISGFVEAREDRERSDRIVVRALTLEGARLQARPQRVRVSVRKGTAPPVGAYVTFRARLNPPLAPLRPGGFDFARDLYFRGIGATGFALGAIRIAEPPQPPGMRLEFAARIQAMRDAIDARIRSVVPGDKGAIASTLITGKRDAISARTSEVMYIASLAHVLAISGYHMAVVAGVVFFAARALLALMPTFASRRPIKKWAAAVALIAATYYLLLSGAAVATQRAFIMTAIVLAGVMADRPALTLRTLAIAAFGVLLIAPQAVVHPSFQMSFAATLALIAAYERGMRWTPKADTPVSARAALWGGREIAGLLLVSLVAGLATTPYAAYHFHRLAPYGLLANLAAMPIVSMWVMPAGLLALAALPFGFDGMLWRLMGEGIGLMIAVATWVAELPGAVGHIAAFGAGPLLLVTGGLVTLCLLRTPLRWCGAVLIVVASLWAVRAPLPDVLAAADGRTVAVRGPDGRLSFHQTGRDAFTLRAWLAADGDGRAPDDTSLRSGGCVPRGLQPCGRGRHAAQCTADLCSRRDRPHAGIGAWPDCVAPRRRTLVGRCGATGRSRPSMGQVAACRTRNTQCHQATGDARCNAPNAGSGAGRLSPNRSGR
jgi:competence protein ComEC